MTFVVAIVGAVASGKTTLANELHQLTGWQQLSIDTEREHDNDWPHLIARVQQLTEPAIIESVATPTAYRAALAHHTTTIVRCRCDEPERQRRLTQRGNTNPAAADYRTAPTAITVNTTRRTPRLARDVLDTIMRRRRTSVCTIPGCPSLRPCPQHGRDPKAHRSPSRDRAAQARFRRAVLTRDNYTCQRCGKHDPTGKTLRACHIRPLAAKGSNAPSNGVTHCEACDKQTDPYAR